MPPLAPERSRRKSVRFLRQAALIGLPVAALVYVGLLSLRQDRALARGEARERAHTIAEEVLQKVWSVVVAPPTELVATGTNSPSSLSIDVTLPAGAFAVDRKGELAFPPLPKPFSLTSLVPESASGIASDTAWQHAQQLEIAALSGDGEARPAINAYQEYLNSSPARPAKLLAQAHYALGLLATKAGQVDEAVKNYQVVISRYPDVATQIDVSLATLAQMKLVELAPRLPVAEQRSTRLTMENLCSNLVQFPTSMSLHLLEKAVLLDKALSRPTPSAPSSAAAAESDLSVPERWLKVWRQHEEAREFYRNSQSLLSEAGSADSNAGALFPANTTLVLPPMYWLDLAGEGDTAFPPGEWLSIRSQVSAWGAWYVPKRLSIEERAFIQDLQRKSGVEAGFQMSVVASLTPGKVRTNNTAIASLLFKELQDSLQRLPRYFGVSIQLADRSLISSNALAGATFVTGGGRGGGSYWKTTTPVSQPEAMATASKLENGKEYIRVVTHLVSPGLLFARQKARTTMFGSLIGISLVVVSVGFASSWRALERQERLAELKTNFVSSVSHELRAPIASVRLMAEGMERGRVTDEAKRIEYCRFIVQECRRLSSLIENVLDFSRIEQGRKQYELEPTDAVALVSQTTTALEPQAAQRQIKLEQMVQGTPVFVHADGRALQQALINLVDNALKHSAAGSVVTVGLDYPARAAESPEPGSQPSLLSSPSKPTIQLWVEDHGTGIPLEEQERIFERFYRLGSELRRETQGVGIGLSIVKHIVEAHGGKVSVRSAPGAGSRFTITLSAADASPVVPGS